MFERIKPEDLAGKGVIGLPDTPKLTTDEMQKKFEETAREVIVPKFNALAEQLEAPAAAAQIGATNAVGAKSTVQLEIERLRSGLKNAENNVEIANENAEDAVEAAEEATKTATEAAAAAVEAKGVAGSARDNANLANVKAEGAIERAGKAEKDAASARETSQEAVKLVETGITGHNTNTNAHADLRMELKALADRINAALDSDDTTLDELSEIVAYIKSNKSLIDAITISKVNVSDIVNDLVTNVVNRPLSAAQGVALKELIDEVKETAKGLDITEFRELSDEQRTAARTNIAAVSYEADQGLNDFARYNARTNIKAVSYEQAPQTPLTDEEKEQARKNIGAAAEGETGAKNAVTYTEQTLAESEKGQARKNIGAAPTSHVDNSGSYGKATFSLFGHVRLMDGANKSQNTDGGFAATPYALWRETSNRVSVEAQELTEEQKEQARANIDAAPKDHRSNTDEYGRGDFTYYGHVRLQDTANESQNIHSGSAATPLSVWNATVDKVSINEQNWTDEQKAQARANIGAAAVGEGGGWVQPDWDAAEGVDGHIKNRTHWKDWEYVEVVPIKDITVMSSTVPNTTDTTTGAYGGIVEGSKVRVYWNGTWYDRTAFVSGNAVYIGNHRILSSTGANTGEPFLLRKVSADRMTIYPEAPLAGAQEVFDYGLKLGEPVYHKLPKEYLPDDIGGGATPDWNAAEGEPGHVLNRTHWSDGVETVEILPTCTPMYDEDEGWFVLADAPALEGGKTYTVNYNGIEYTCVGFDARSIGETGVAIGDVYTLSGGMIGTAPTGEPFALVSAFEDGVQAMVIIDLTGATEVTLSISETRGNIHKLDNKYLDLDWIPKAGKRVFNGMTISTDTSQLSGESVYVFSLPASESGASIIDGDVYEVVLDGMKYTCKGTARQESTGIVLLGNLGFLSLPDVENTGEPFLMVSAVNLNDFQVIGSYFSDPNADKQTISLSITDVSGVKKLPEEFLPDSVPLLFNVPFTVDLVGQEATCDLSFAEVYAKASNFNIITRCVAQMSGADQVALGALAAISSNELSFSVAMGVDSSTAEIFTIIMHSDDTCSLAMTQV